MSQIHTKQHNKVGSYPVDRVIDHLFADNLHPPTEESFLSELDEKGFLTADVPFGDALGLTNSPSEASVIQIEDPDSYRYLLTGVLDKVGILLKGHYLSGVDNAVMRNLAVAANISVKKRWCLERPCR